MTLKRLQLEYWNRKKSGGPGIFYALGKGMNGIFLFVIEVRFLNFSLSILKFRDI